MSGIAGVWHLDGQPAAPEALRAMLQALVHRGPDAEDRWIDGPIALGYRASHTTPESVAERQPCAVRDGTLVLVADGRIDNRVELSHDLAAHSLTPRTQTDAELILLAYERWGGESPAHLLGDFAFAIWDTTRRRLFCARDALGVKPLYYHWDGTRLVFASEITALLTVSGVPTQINEEFLAQEFLSDYRCDYRDPDATFFAGIQQLRPAHSLTIDAQGLRLRRYWQPTPSGLPRRASAAEWLERFHGLFREAVRCRLRSIAPVGMAFSGGIDSTCITAMAETLRRADPSLPALHAFTSMTMGVLEEEWDAIQRLMQAFGTPVQFLERPSRLSTLIDCYRTHSETPQPYGALSSPALLQAAASSGCRVLLTGFAGDELIATSELGLLEDLLRGGRFPSLIREITRLAWSGRDTRWAVTSELLREQVPAPFRWALRSILRRQVPSWIAPDFARRCKLAWRLPPRHARRFRRQAQERSVQAVTGPIMTLTLNHLDSIASRAGLEWRYPYLDRRLIEFCLAVPSDIRRAVGYRKGLLQRALSGIVPGPIRAQMGDRYRVSLHLDQSDRILEASRFEQLLSACRGPIARYSQPQQVRDLARAYAGGQITARTPMWKLMSLSHWLDAFFSESESPSRDAQQSGWHDSQREQLSA